MTMISVRDLLKKLWQQQELTVEDKERIERIRERVMDKARELKKEKEQSEKQKGGDENG